MRKWRIDDSAELYNINGWGLKYFSINDRGHVEVTPREGCAPVDLKEVLDELQVRDVTCPVLLRFPDILDNRIEKISRCFKLAAEEYNYKADNFIIYPIKVNQMRQVVEEIVTHGKNSISGLRPAQNPSSTPFSPQTLTRTPSSSATDIRTRVLSSWRCLPRRWGAGSILSSRSSTSSS